MTDENLIKRAICYWLKKNRPDIFFWVNDTLGIFDKKINAYRKNTDPFRIKGPSDILGILSDGRFLAVEVKTDKGRVSEDQAFFIAEVKRRGGIAFVARSIEDVQEGLQ